MEKHVLLSVLIMVVFLNLSAVTADKVSMEECKTKEGVTNEDFKNSRNPDQAATQKMKCFTTCLAEKSGKIINNKLNNDGVLSFIKTLPNYSQQMEQSVNEILAECKKIEDPDRCNFGSKLVSCLKEGAKQRGLKGVFMSYKRA